MLIWRADDADSDTLQQGLRPQRELVRHWRRVRGRERARVGSNRHRYGLNSANSCKLLAWTVLGWYASVVKGTPGTLQEGGASFASTHWSIVAQSAQTDVPEAANALAQLCETYWPPIYSFIRRRGYAPSDAEDLTQSFFAYFLRTKAYSRTDRLHGKFRSFLLASVKNFLADNWDRDQAIRRGGGYRFVSLDQGAAEIANRRRARIFASRIACGRQSQTLRTTEELSHRRRRPSFL
jgi:DNA-directed RNA polymerase specialized sigma24 family protein